MLDGLRGWAALCVLFYHIFYQILPVPLLGDLTTGNWRPFPGFFAVSVFFLVSGFSLSKGYLDTGRTEILCRLLLGRYFRLVIPVLAASTAMSLFMNLGLVPSRNEMLADFHVLFQFDPTWAHLLKFSLWDVFFDYRIIESYAPPMWTISFEFKASLIIVCLLWIFGKFDRQVMTLALGLVAVATFFSIDWVFPFIVGVMIAANHKSLTRSLTLFISVALFLSGMLIAGLAAQSDHAVHIGATLTFVGALYALPVREFLSSRFSRILGDISFPLYLIHVPIIFAFGMPIYLIDPASHFFTMTGALISIVLSIVVAFMMMPINNWSISFARIFGVRMTKLVLNRRNETSSRSDSMQGQ